MFCFLFWSVLSNLQIILGIEYLNLNTSFHSLSSTEEQKSNLIPSFDVDTFNPKAGISIGISIAITLILLTVVILFLIKRFCGRREVYVGVPLEQEEQLLRNTTDSDTFLYLQKLKEIREQDSSTFGGIDSSQHNSGELPIFKVIEKHRS